MAKSQSHNVQILIDSDPVHPFLRTAITLITGNILLPFLVTIISLVRLWNRFHRLASSSWTEGAPTSSLWQLVDRLVDGPRQESRCSGTSDILTFNLEPLYPNFFSKQFPLRFPSQDVCASWEFSDDCSTPIVNVRLRADWAARAEERSRAPRRLGQDGGPPVCVWRYQAS